MQIAILLFDEVDLLDFGGPYEVFLTASRLLERQGKPRLFEVSTATIDGQGINAYGGLSLVPDKSLAELAAADVLIVPGTIDIDKVMAKQSIISAISNHAALNADGDRVIASVCTGAFLLAEAGLLNDRDWTTHWEDIDLLAEKIGFEGAKRNVRWVDTGSIVTGAGLSSGIDMALHLVCRYADEALALQTAKQIDHAWNTLPGMMSNATT